MSNSEQKETTSTSSIKGFANSTKSYSNDNSISTNSIKGFYNTTSSDSALLSSDVVSDSTSIPTAGISSALSGKTPEEILSAIESAKADNSETVSTSNDTSVSSNVTLDSVAIPTAGVSSLIANKSPEEILSAVESVKSDNSSSTSSIKGFADYLKSSNNDSSTSTSSIKGFADYLKSSDSDNSSSTSSIKGFADYKKNLSNTTKVEGVANYDQLVSNSVGINSLRNIIRTAARNNSSKVSTNNGSNSTTNNTSSSSVAIAVPSYSYNRGIITLIDDSSNIDFLRKEIMEKFNTLSSYAYNEARITNTADSAYSAEVVGTVTEFPLRPFCSKIFGGIPTQNGNYISSLSSDFVEMTNLANNCVEYNDEFFYFCGSLSQVTSFAQNGKVFTSQGYTVQGTNPGYSMVNSLITDINSVIVKKCDFFKIFYEKLIQYNLQIVRNLSTKINAVDLENNIYANVYGYIRGTSKNYIKFYVNSGRQDYLFEQFISTYWNKLVSDFNSLKNNINTLKSKLENFCSYYDISVVNESDYYDMPKYDGSNTQQFTGNTENLSNDLNSLNDIYTSLKIPNSGNLRVVVSGRACFSGSGLSNKISDVDNDLLSLKKSFENLTDHVEEVIKGIGNSNSQTTDIIANEVIRGNWGNGAERKAKLEAAGYNYDEIQARVNEILLGTGATVTTATTSVVANMTTTSADTSSTIQYRVTEDSIDSVVLDTTRKEYLEKLELAEKEATRKLAELKEQQQKEIDKLKQEQAEKIEKLKQEQEKELAQLKEQQDIKDAEIEKMKQEQAQELEKLKKQQEQELEKLKQQQAQELEKLKQDNADEISKIKQQAQSTPIITNGSSVNNTTQSSGSTIVSSDSTTDSSTLQNNTTTGSDSESIIDVTEKPSYTTTTTNKVTQTSDKSGNAGVVGAVLGIGALGAAGVVGARYIKKKKENETYSDDENYFSNDEEFSEVKETDIEESDSKYKAGSVNSLVLDDSSDIDTTNSNITSSDTLDFE